MAERFARDHDRFAQIVARDALCLLARNLQRVREMLREILAVAGERRGFQPLPDRWIAQNADATGRQRCDNVRG